MSNEEKYRCIMKCMHKWMVNLENKKEIADYLCALGVQYVGVYGYGILGKHLVRELLDKGMTVSWVIDRISGGDAYYSKIIRPDDLDNLEKVDLVVITALADMERVEMLFSGKPDAKIISVDELVDSVFGWGNQR